jgi:hypothetical protein
LFSSIKVSTDLKRSLGFFKRSFKPLICSFCVFINCSAASAVMASILLTPAATALSETILKYPICQHALA